MILKLFSHNLRFTTGIGIILLSLVLISYISNPEPLAEVHIPEEEDVVEDVIDSVLPNFYVLNGIVSDSLIHYEGSIKKNQSLSEILLRFNVSYSLIDALAKKSKDVWQEVQHILL